MGKLSSAGLTYVWTIPVILTGPSTAVHSVRINVQAVAVVCKLNNEENLDSYLNSKIM
ncbi:MAG: hypothetical protein WBF33_15745 [Candidatus Nitrosopolaris sp.]